MKELPAGILMDLDDTILDERGNVERCWADACAAAGILTPGLDAEALPIEIRVWSDASRDQRGRLDLRSTSRKIVREVFERIGCDAALAADVADHYRDLRDERTRPFPGAIEALDWLRSRGVKLGMMTNGAAQFQRPKIERFGLAPYFERIIIEDEFGCGKPDPRVFTSLLDALRVKPEETWAVGDNIELDVFGAMDVGIRGIWIDATGRGLPERTSRKPDVVIASICELMKENP